MAATKKRINYTTIKIGEYEVTTKGQKHMRKVFSRVPVETATRLGVKHNPDGEKIIRKIKKGTATGAQYAAYVLGVRGKGYRLTFLKAGAKTGSDATSGRLISNNNIRIPTPTGTPLHVIAAFVAKLKTKPTKIITPKGESYWLNNSARSQGK
jgi:hypothetical protein